VGCSERSEEHETETDDHGAWLQTCDLPGKRLASAVRRAQLRRMQVRRIVANVPTPSPEQTAAFYRDVLGLEVLMDMGWIVTFGADVEMSVQVSFASEGGSGTAVPDLSIEVDDLDEALRRVRAGGFPIVFGPVAEPWGVRRFYVRDPLGRVVNLLSHG